MQELKSKKLKYSTTWYDFGRMANVDGASQGPWVGTNIYHQVGRKNFHWQTQNWKRGLEGKPVCNMTIAEGKGNADEQGVQLALEDSWREIRNVHRWLIQGKCLLNIYCIFQIYPFLSISLAPPFSPSLTQQSLKWSGYFYSCLSSASFSQWPGDLLKCKLRHPQAYRSFFQLHFALQNKFFPRTYNGLRNLAFALLLT